MERGGPVLAAEDVVALGHRGAAAHAGTVGEQQGDEVGEVGCHRVVEGREARLCGHVDKAGGQGESGGGGEGKAG